MFTFNFCYVDGTKFLVEHVTKVYIRNGNIDGFEEINGYELLDRNFAIDTELFLRSDVENCTVSTENLRAIRITEERIKED